MRKGKSEILECFLGERQAPCRQRLFIAIFSMHSHRPSMSRIAAARAGYQFWSVICILVTSTNQQVHSTCCCNSANGDQGLCIENIIYSVYDPTIRRQQSSKLSWEKARDATDPGVAWLGCCFQIEMVSERLAELERRSQAQSEPERSNPGNFLKRLRVGQVFLRQNPRQSIKQTTAF